MAEQNFTYESVFRHLRTGLCGFTDEEIDRLENYCLALDIKGYKKWQQAWVRRTPSTGERTGRTESSESDLCRKDDGTDTGSEAEEKDCQRCNAGSI